MNHRGNGRRVAPQEVDARPAPGGGGAARRRGAVGGRLVQEAAATACRRATYFEQQVWSGFMGSVCTKCHTPDGTAVADSNAKLVLETSQYPGFIDANLATLTTVANIQNQGTSELLLKPVGKLSHGGGVVIQQGGPQYKALVELVSRLTSSSATCAASPDTTIQSVTLADAPTTLRRAAIDLAGRLPTAAETATVTSGGDTSLDAALDALMTEDIFFTRIREIFNDVLLTDEYLEYGGRADRLHRHQVLPGHGPLPGSVEPVLHEPGAPAHQPGAGPRAARSHRLHRQERQALHRRGRGLLHRGQPVQRHRLRPRQDHHLPGSDQLQRVPPRAGHGERERDERPHPALGRPLHAGVPQPLAHHAHQPQPGARAAGVQLLPGHRRPQDRGPPDRPHQGHGPRGSDAQLHALQRLSQGHRPRGRRLPRLRRQQLRGVQPGHPVARRHVRARLRRHPDGPELLRQGAPVDRPAGRPGSALRHLLGPHRVPGDDRARAHRSTPSTAPIADLRRQAQRPGRRRTPSSATRRRPSPRGTTTSS